MRQLVHIEGKWCKSQKLRRVSALKKKKQRLTIFRRRDLAAGPGCYPRVFGIDVLKCECGSELKPVSAILKGDEIKRYLRHLGLDAYPPELEETETKDKSVAVSLFEADSYEKESVQAHPEEFPIINHD